MGFSHSLQRHFAETARELELADQQLGEPGDGGADWWEEKVQIQMERMHLFYWEGMVREMRELAEQYCSVIAERGAAAQRAEFLKMMALSMLMESHFRPSQECIELARRAVAASDEANNPAQAGHVNFVLELIELWHGDFRDAVEQGEKALAIAEQTGDLVLQSRCLTYRAVAFRRLGDIARCATEAERTLKLARKLGMTEYIAMAKASLAWIAWRQEDHPQAEKLASEALELWHGMDDPYGFDWMALCPLIAIALHQNNSSVAIGFARGLLAENQHPLPENLLSPIRKACDEWQTGARENATADLACAMKVARELSYL
jgi:tetratricopeptide (TPR) repeat protein